VGLAIGALAALLLFTAPAGAAFPGANGKIAAAGCDTDCGIFVMNPDGSARTQQTHGEICQDPEGDYSNGAYQPASPFLRQGVFVP
jgi:hypothetical protein